MVQKMGHLRYCLSTLKKEVSMILVQAREGSVQKEPLESEPVKIYGQESGWESGN